MRRICLLLLLLPFAACGSDSPRAPAATVSLTPGCDVAAARSLSDSLGARLRLVPLLAPDSVRKAAIREAYARFATSALIARWLSDPSRAPGRRVSSPWPERIRVDSVTPAGEDGCQVTGEVVYSSSARATVSPVAPVTLLVERQPDKRWLIAEYEEALTEAQAADTGSKRAAHPADSARADAAAAAAVIRSYYAAIAAHRYSDAYLLWADSGRASQQQFADFERGYAATARVQAEVGTPGPIGAAAGSRYVEVPVTVNAITTGGQPQRFRGTVTLRRSVVDGATSEQRAWRIYSARLRPIP